MINVGSTDRVLRFVAGAALVAAPFVPAFAPTFAGLGEWKYAVAAIGLVMLATAAFRFCPAYVLFGVKTCAPNER